MKSEELLFNDQIKSDLSVNEQEALFQALQASFSPDADQRLSGMKQVRSLHGHHRSPLTASVLVHRLREPDTDVLAEVVDLLASILSDVPDMEMAQISRRWASHALRQIGRRELENLLGLILVDDSWLESGATILSECSFAGELLLDVFTDGTRELNQRLLAIELIDQAGFLEAVPMIEHWIDRLVSRQERQLRMTFAPAPDMEAEAILPALRSALVSLGGSSQG
jgi:hypothetical protein